MHNQEKTKLLCFILAIALSLLVSDKAFSVREYALECAETYSECGGDNLPNSCDNVFAMRSEIDDDLAPNWIHGWLFTESSAWPQDWREAATTSGGLDTSFMDAIDHADLSVWSGHGTGAEREPNGSWDLAMGFRHNGACETTSPSQMIMGEQSSDGFGNDGDNEYVIMDASCSMVNGERQQVWENWGPGILMRAHQGMAFHNSPDDSDDRLEEFIENIDDGDSNNSAWLDAGESCFTFWCWNSPSVMTFGSTSADANDRHSNETMRSPRADAPSGWGGSYRWQFIDNGGC